MKMARVRRLRVQGLGSGVKGLLGTLGFGVVGTTPLVLVWG